MGIAWRELAIFLPIGTTHNVVNPCFAHNVKARILSLDGFAPTHHLVEIVIWIGVLADAIDVHPFNPPDACLNQVVHHQTVLLVEVGHGLHKPAVGSVLVTTLGGIRVVDGSCAIRRRHKLAVIVKPVVAWTVGKQEILAAAVVKHNVEDVFHTLGMSSLNETLGFIHGAVAGIRLIIIGDGIAMKRLLRHIVFQDRSGPDGCHTKVVKIVEARFHTRQVAAVTGFLTLRVASLLFHAGNAIVLRVAVGKTVGHQQIHHIARIKRAETATIALLQFIRNFLNNLFTILKQNIECVWLGILERKIQDNIVLVVGLNNFLQFYVLRILKLNVVGAQVCTIYKDLQIGVIHSCPPKLGMDVLNLNTRLFCSECRLVECHQ